jgi:hypothetical protein
MPTEGDARSSVVGEGGVRRQKVGVGYAGARSSDGEEVGARGQKVGVG